MQITLSNGGATTTLEVPPGTEVGHIRTFSDELEDIGAPSSFTLAVDGVGVEDSTTLRAGQTVTLRPLQGSKG